MGARLFAWLGGLALFLGVAYFVKYSFDRNLIPPSARVLMGLAAGVGLILGGHRLRQGLYRVTSQTLCGTGIVILYASLFAGHAFYELTWLPSLVTFAGMIGVTIIAFALSVRMDAQAVSVLGMLGGFLTPVLLSKGQDQAVPLYLYVGLLDLGLIAVARIRRWDALPVGAALGTLIMEFGWAARFFAEEKVWATWVYFGGFALLFLAALAWARRGNLANFRWAASAAIPAGFLLAWGAWLLGPGGFGARPGTAFAFILTADLCLVGMALLWSRSAWIQNIAGGIVFVVLIAWMGISMTGDLLYWGLGWSLVFAGIHGAFPIIQRRWDPSAPSTSWSSVFPSLAILGLLAPLVRLDQPSFAVWPTVLLLNLLAMLLATSSTGLAGALAAVVLSGFALFAWIGSSPAGSDGTWIPVLLVTAMSVILVGLGTGLLVRRRNRQEGEPLDEAVRVPVAAALMPFFLLTQLVMHLRMPNPILVLTATGIMVVLLLGLSAWLRLGSLPFVGLLGATIVGHAWWYRESFSPTHPGTAVVCFIMLYALFAGFAPSLRRRLKGLRLPWISTAVAAIPFFHLVYRIVEVAWPNRVMGLVPLAFAVPVAGLFAVEYRRLEPEGTARLDGLDRLAWLGGVGLFLVTVALPIQFNHQWLTLGLAIEGAALIGLYRQVPHDGLRRVGPGLLSVVFGRLVLNPYVLEYAVRSPWPLWNWWLYTYGVSASMMFAGAVWLRPPDYRILGKPVRSLLMAFGTLLLFALVNAQIADFFTQPGEVVRFQFSGNFGRDMTYTIAWALFALGLVVIGLRRSWTPCRWAGLSLLAVAILKLFLHDLARLDQLYRVGALMGVAVVAILASVFYQKFSRREQEPEPRQM